MGQLGSSNTCIFFLGQIFVLKTLEIVIIKYITAIKTTPDIWKVIFTEIIDIDLCFIMCFLLKNIYKIILKLVFLKLYKFNKMPKRFKINLYNFFNTC